MVEMDHHSVVCEGCTGDLAYLWVCVLYMCEELLMHEGSMLVHSYPKMHFGGYKHVWVCRTHESVECMGVYVDLWHEECMHVVPRTWCVECMGALYYHHREVCACEGRRLLLHPYCVRRASRGRTYLDVRHSVRPSCLALWCHSLVRIFFPFRHSGIDLSITQHFPYL
jgi:hypothetical protein